MDSQTRAQLIRQGNAAFNDGDIRKAREIFLKTGYKDGLVRLGDYFMYDRKLPMLAFGYYKKAGMQSKVDEIYQRMIYALSTWIGRDKFKVKHNSETPANQENDPLDPNDFQVHPILRAKALEILAKNKLS